MKFRIVSHIDESFNGDWQDLSDPILEKQIEPLLGSTGQKGFVRLFPRNGNFYDVQNPQPDRDILAKGANYSSISSRDEWAIDFKDKAGTVDPLIWRVSVKI